ncbi:MAG: glycosyltransferase, partial [Planctomycetota bacterium]
MTTELDFSVILPVCHGGRFLRSALASARGLDYPSDRFEVLVAGHDGSGETSAIAREAAQEAAFELRYVESAEPGRSAKLNAACHVARGRVLAFADDDCVLPAEWLRKLSEAFEAESDLGALGGADEFDGEAPRLGAAIDWVLNSFVGTGGCRGPQRLRAGKYYPRLWNMAVPRAVAESVRLAPQEGAPGLFDESLDVHEDVELAERIERSGRRVAFAPEVRVRHSRDTTFWLFLRRNLAMARAARRLGVHRLAHGVLAAGLLGAVALGVGSVLWGPLRPAFYVCAATYAALLAVSGVRACRAAGRLSALLLVPALLCG